jgi:dihydropteroate synthase
MHMQGEPRTMQSAPQYGDVVAEVAAYLGARRRACVEAGIAADRILLDPGFGFGKNLEHNLRLTAGLPQLQRLGCPLLVGYSRKSMFQHLLGLPVDQRLPASLAAATLAAWLGASIIRAHDVRPTVEALKVAAAIRQAGEQQSR